MQQIILLLTSFAVLPPVAIESDSELGIFTDGGFTAGFTLTPISFKVSDDTGQASVVAELKLQGKTGNLSINNPFLDARLVSTCHILVYDETAKLVVLVSESLGRATPESDVPETRLILIPGRAMGRTIRFQIPRDRIGPGRSLYAQGVLLDTAPRGTRPPVEVGDVTSLAQYRETVSGHVVAMSQPVQLNGPQRVQPAAQARRDGGVSVSLFRPKARPNSRNPAKITARVTNNSDRNVYVAPHLYLPVDGWPEEPTLVLETRDWKRIGMIDNGQALWPSASMAVCRMPPGAFIECDWTYGLHEVQETAIASQSAPISLRLVDLPVLVRDPPNDPPAVMVSRPRKDAFSRFPISASNSIEINWNK